jgi:hypothetical protein
MAVSPLPVFRLDARCYDVHDCHRGERDWLESNCYIDVYVEVLHALGVDVYACLPFTLASDFDGDQWTFFKPPLAELRLLYGVSVQELTLWRPLVEHAENHVARGEIVIPEVDAWFLPDVAATDYRRNHVKTTVAIAEIDRDAKRLGYFHNCGYHLLEGEDFDGIFRLGREEHEDYLPPYCELMKVDRILHRAPEELRRLSMDLARGHLAHRPLRNPMQAYGERLERDLEWLVEQDEAVYHDYVFATLRQCGAGFEFAAFYLEWLDRGGESGMADIAMRFRQISTTAKMLVMKIARIARSKKVRDLGASVTDMGRCWDEAMNLLDERLGA